MFFGEDGGEEVAVFFDAGEEVGGFEVEEVGVFLFEGFFDFGPGDGGADGGVFACAEGVDADGGFVIVVLGPVHEDAAGAFGFEHVGGDEVGVLAFEEFGEAFGEGFGVVEGRGGVEGDVEVHAFSAAGFGEGLYAEMVEEVADDEEDFDGFKAARGWAGVKVEGERGGPFGFGHSAEEAVEFDGGEIGGPCESGGLVDGAVVEEVVVVFGPELGGFDPVGLVGGTAFFVEEHFVDAVGVAFEGDGAAFEMGEDGGSHSDVVVDDLSFGETGSGVEDLVEVGEGHFTFADGEGGRGGHADFLLRGV